MKLQKGINLYNSIVLIVVFSFTLLVLSACTVNSNKQPTTNNYDNSAKNGTLTTLALSGDPDNKGVDFWSMFNFNLDNPSFPSELKLFLTSDLDTSGTVEVPGLGFSTPFTITANTVTTIDLPIGARVDSSDLVEDKGVHVTAADEIVVYGLNRRQHTTDMFLGLPTGILGTEYINLGYKNTSHSWNGTQFGIVGVENNTTVTITPSETTGSRTVGVPYTINLNQGSTYQLTNTTSSGDLSGTIISSDKPIAVFGSNRCANIPNSITLACDHIVEQLPPTTTWGESFITMPLATRLNGDTFRMLASEDNTNVSVNGAVVANLNKGELHEQIIDGPATITADNPILVAQYSNGTTFDGVTSDPFMMLIPPFEQFLADYTISTPASGFSANFVNIVTSDAGVGLVTLDGVAIPAGDFAAIGTSGFSGAQVPVSIGSHHLSSSLPFGVFSYGYDSFDSYGYPAGMSLAPIAVVSNIDLLPPSATNPVGVEHCVTATVTDQDGNPLPDIRVDFDVTGVNPNMGFSNTDVNGEAEFCYIGNNGGDDNIEASVGSLSDNATSSWIDNQDPDCSSAEPSINSLWPPNHKFVAVEVLGVTDPDGDPVNITIDSVFQDEAVDAAGSGNTSPDGQGVGTSTAEVRAERSGLENGRVYNIGYTADDENGGTCSGTVRVGVPHDKKDTPIDDGALFDSTTP